MNPAEYQLVDSNVVLYFLQSTTTKNNPKLRIQLHIVNRSFWIFDCPASTTFVPVYCFSCARIEFMNAHIMVLAHDRNKKHNKIQRFPSIQFIRFVRVCRTHSCTTNQMGNSICPLHVRNTTASTRNERTKRHNNTIRDIYFVRIVAECTQQIRDRRAKLCKVYRNLLGACTICVCACAVCMQLRNKCNLNFFTQTKKK